MNKHLVVSLFLVGSILATSSTNVSADIISTTDALQVSKSVKMTPTYTLTVGDLSQDDWKSNIVSVDNSSTETSSQPNSSKEDHGVTLTPATNSSDTITELELTDVGVKKIKDMTGVSDTSMFKIVGRFKNKDASHVGTTFTGENPEISDVTVFVTKTLSSKSVSSTKEASNLIKKTKAIQSKDQKQVQNLSSSEKELVSDSNIPVISGVDVSTKNLSTKKLNQKSASDQKNVKKLVEADNKKKLKAKIWSFVGYGLIVIAGLLSGFGLYKLSKKLKGK